MGPENKWEKKLDKSNDSADKEAFFSRLCSMMKTLGAPNYYPKYMILHGMNAFLGIEGDGLKPNFDADREWEKILRNDLSCKDKK